MKLSALALVLCATQALVGAQLQPAHSGVVHGVLCASNDQGLRSGLKKQFLAGMKLESLQAKFDASRYHWVNWGRRSAILIDDRLPLLQELASRISLLRAMTKCGNSDRVLNLQDLPASERAELVEYVRRTFPYSDVDSLASGRSALGLSFRTEVSISSQNRSISVKLPEDEGRGNRDTKLAGRPVDSLNLTNRRKEELQRNALESSASRELMSLQWLGIAESNMQEGLEVLAKALKALIDERTAQAEDLARSLALRCGIATSSLPVAGAVGDMPKDLRDMVRDRLVLESRLHGFVQPSDADAFLSGPSDFQVRTTLSLAFCTKPGGDGKPAVFYALELGSFPGGTMP